MYFNNLNFLGRDSDDHSKHILEYIMDLSVKDTTSVEKEQQTVERINKLVQTWKSHQFKKNLTLFSKPKTDKISFWQEVNVLTKRTFKLTFRDYKRLLVFNVGIVIIGVTVGWMFYRPKHDLAGIRSLTSTLYVAMEIMGFVPMYFEIERLWETDGVFFYREYSENQVSIPGFLISRRLGKLFLEDLPMSLLFSIITFFMWGLRLGDGSHFGIYFVCCGYFVNAATMPVYVKWTKYLAYFWYAFGALTNNQFSGWHGKCPYNDINDPRCQEFSGDYQIKILGFPVGWVGAPIGYLVLWTVGFFVLSGILFYFKQHDVSMAKTKKNTIGEGEEDHEALHQKKTEREQDYITDKHDLEININNIHLDVTTSNLFGQTKSTKTLLDNVTASFQANKTFTKFQIYSTGINSFKWYSKISRDQLSKISAYVTQHDSSLIEQLTVRETLYYQAKLRLPLDQHKFIPTIINKLIRQTGLVDCADTLIGSEYVKGISGGEKRRVSIAIQLLSKPKVLFLDEPTSGLDSSTAETILTLLGELAKENNTTIILTIHQPSEQLFYKFGSLLLLGRGGKVIYDGTSVGIVEYLESLGYNNPEGHNIADYILDLISRGMNEDKMQSERRVAELISYWQANSIKKLCSTATFSQEIIDLPQYYYQRLPIFITFPTIFRRQLLTSYRAKDVVINRAGQTIFLAIVHTLYFTPLRNTQEGISNRLGLVQEVLNLYFAGLINNITLYPFERNLFYQEYRDGIYGVTEFGTPQMFFAMFGTGFVSINCGESLGIFVNSIFTHMGVATNVLSTFVSLAIFMGGTMSLHMPGFFKGINFISPMKYAVAICANLGFENQSFKCNSEAADCLLTTGEDVLSYYNMKQNLGPMVGGLIGCLVIYRVVAILSIYVRVKWF
ncbi:ABC transporter family protein [Candida albicans]|uniref:ABC transporter family protein n=1 Tax=Candida albicans TaxID=5476 RepID=A0A8H6C1P6_CANAX|nr:ABC transporter family protein [Candida albicans]